MPAKSNNNVILFPKSVETFLDEIPNGIFVLTPKGNLKWINKSMEKTIQYKAKEINGKSFIQTLVSSTSDQKKITKHIAKSTKEIHYPLFITIKTKTNKYKNVKIKFNSRKINNQQCLIGSFDDVTYEVDYEIRHGHLDAIIEQAAESILITDTKADILYANPYFEKLTGYKKDDIIGKNPRILKSGKNDPQLYLQLWEQISQGKIWRGKLTNKRKDGTLYIEDIVIFPIKDKKSKIIGYASVKRDITKEEETSQKLEKHLRLLEKFKDATVDLALEMKVLQKENESLKKKLSKTP